MTYDRDGWPDLYVVNDFGRKNLYRNNGDGTFTDVAAAVGSRRCRRRHERVLARLRQRRRRRPLRRQHVDGRRRTHHGARRISARMLPKQCPRSLSQARMGNSLFRVPNRAHQDMTKRAASGVEMGRWSWSSDAWDFDHDGFADLYITNGMVSGPSRDDLNSFFWRQVVANSPDKADASLTTTSKDGTLSMNSSAPTAPGAATNAMFSMPTIAMEHFPISPASSGLDFVEDGRSFALADFDHDGRLEVISEESQCAASTNSEERDCRTCRHRSLSACVASRAIATRSARLSL